MIKRVFIPLVILGEPARGDLLELYIEPRRFRPASYFSALQSAGLDAGVALAENALQQLGLHPGYGMVYVSDSQPLLSNSTGTALGLVMADVMSCKHCLYRTLIASAELSLAAGGYGLKYNGFWAEKLAALLTLQAQPQTVPLILAADTPLTAEQKGLLLTRNIQPYLFEHLVDAVNFIIPTLGVGMQGATL